jgi:hypothetical protein
MKLTVVAIALASLGFLAFGSLESLEQEKIKNTKTITVENNKLLKKWRLSHYELFGSDFDPELNEKKDYIHFHKDNTYSSISEGFFEKGDYKLDKKTIVMTNTKEKVELKLVIKELTETTLSVSIDDPNDSDAKYLTIHFKN